VADTFNSEINVGPPPVALPKRRRSGVIGIIIVLLILGGAGGYLWLNYSETLTDMAHAVTGSTGSHDGAQVLASAPAEGSVSAADFAAFQQQTGSSIQTATELLAAQQAELKRLSDQIQGLTTQVAGLTAKIDQTQGRAAVPQAAPAPVAAHLAPTPARPAPTAPRKRPVADRPAGAISVGGAPLPPQPAR
jgi:hypothetical protein